MIAILLCTYNGSKYLATQIESILQQTEQDFIIYIHDDGSTDDTLRVISSYIQKYPSKIEFLPDETKYRGAGASFMWLLQNVSSDYYMFCDQDDYWISTKVEHTFLKIKEMESIYPNKPILIHTDLYITDSELNVTQDSFWQYHNYKVDISKKKHYIGFGNIVTGCTMMINRTAKEIVFPYSADFLHDYWIALKVAQHGYIDNIKEQTILYRQHGCNEAGAGDAYSKRHIGFHAFFSNIHKEIPLYKMVSGGSLMEWFLRRVAYFYYKHFAR